MDRPSRAVSCQVYKELDHIDHTMPDGRGTQRTLPPARPSFRSQATPHRNQKNFSQPRPPPRPWASFQHPQPQTFAFQTQKMIRPCCFPPGSLHGAESSMMRAGQTRVLPSTSFTFALSFLFSPPHPLTFFSLSLSLPPFPFIATCCCLRVVLNILVFTLYFIYLLIYKKLKRYNNVISRHIHE